MTINVPVPSTETVPFSKEDAKVARLWAIDQGHTVPSRGSVSGDTLLAWHFAGRPHYEIPTKFSIPKAEGSVFRAWAKANGHEADEAGYSAWDAAGKPEPEGYMDSDTIAVMDFNVDGEIVSRAIDREELRNVRGIKRGKATSAELLNAADWPENGIPVRVTMRSGDMHTIEPAADTDSETDRTIGYVVRYTVAARKETLSTVRAELESVTAERDALSEALDKAQAEIETLRAELATATAEPEKPKRAPRTRKPKAAAAEPETLALDTDA